MHPVLLSLANIEPGVHMKATSHSFVLAAYLFTLKFNNVSVPVQAALAAHVYHSCLTIVTENLQQAAWEGVEITDPLGRIHVCYPALVFGLLTLLSKGSSPVSCKISLLSQRQPLTTLALTTLEMDLVIKIGFIEITMEHCSIYILL